MQNNTTTSGRARDRKLLLRNCDRENSFSQASAVQPARQPIGRCLWRLCACVRVFVCICTPLCAAQCGRLFCYANNKHFVYMLALYAPIRALLLQRSAQRTGLQSAKGPMHGSYARRPLPVPVRVVVQCAFVHTTATKAPWAYCTHTNTITGP